MDDALERLAMRLHAEVAHINPTCTVDWDDLSEGEREAYRTCVEGLLMDWNLVKQARACVEQSSSE